MNVNHLCWCLLNCMFSLSFVSWVTFSTLSSDTVMTIFTIILTLDQQPRDGFILARILVIFMNIILLITMRQFLFLQTVIIIFVVNCATLFDKFVHDCWLGLGLYHHAALHAYLLSLPTTTRHHYIPITLHFYIPFRPILINLPPQLFNLLSMMLVYMRLRLYQLCGIL